MRHLVWIALALGVTLSGQAQVERRPDGFPYLSHGRYWFVKNFTRSLQDLTVHSDMKQGDSTILAALHPTAGEALPLITPTTAKDVKVFHVFENSKCAFVVYSLGSTSNSRFAILKKNRPEATDALVRASEGKDLPFCEAKNFNKPFQEDTWIVFPVNSKLNIGFMNPNIDAIAAEAERRRFTPGETFAFFTKNYYLGEPFSTKEKEIIRWVFGTEDVGEGLFIRQEAQMDPNSLAGFEGWDPKDFLDEGDKFYPWYSLDIFGDNVRFFWENQYIAPDPGVTPDLAIIYLSEMGDRAWRAHFDVPPDGAVWLDRQKSFALENSYIVISDNFLFLLIHEKPFSGKNPYTKERTILIFHTDEHINYTALEAGDLKVKDYHWKFVDGVRILDTNTAQPFSPADLHLNDGSAGL
ncbi:MAG: hypothetical protein LBU03_01610, partial [Tannerellaceae bacterium]|nr:hypothetical protein [Tannerellaceae bacterium]